ncbi:hypothetical protein [Streptomyces scabiei]|uniref:hypothetical protein n=1 Tax=Streptomyces scabiei TaxID=1930 RepID=UPI002FF1E968
MELAAEVGHPLPETDPEALAAWFYEAANSGDLVRYIPPRAHPRGAADREGLLRTAESTCSTWPPTVSSTARCATPRADTAGGSP